MPGMHGHNLGQQVLPGQLRLPGVGLDRCCLDVADRARNRTSSSSLQFFGWHGEAFVRQAQAEGNRRPFKHLFRSNDPTLLAVLLEDSIAVGGVLLAITGIGLTRLTGNGIWDVSFSSHNRIGTGGGCSDIGRYQYAVSNRCP